MHSGTFCMHSVTFWNILHAFWNILHAFWNILHAFWNFLEYSGIVWNILELYRFAHCVRISILNSHRHTDIRTCLASSSQLKMNLELFSIAGDMVDILQKS